MGFRKGADVDEELWPADEFGGVSDEQFWDDLASDKPLTTTARTAQQDPGTRNRPLAAVPPAATQRVQKMPPAQKTQPVQNQPVQKMPPAQPLPAPVPTATQPVQAAAAASRPVSATASRPVSATASRPVSAASQPPETAAPPAETRGRRRASISADEDPLTSAAFALRSSGPVDGRSSRRSRDMTSEQYDSTSTQETRTFSPTNAPPYGENYGYDARNPAPRANDPRRQNGTRSHARHDGTGEGTRTARQAYPQDGYQTGSYQTGEYPSGGYPAGDHQGNGYQRGSYPTGSPQGSGYPGGSHRAPYDPREDYRRLTQRL